MTGRKAVPMPEMPKEAHASNPDIPGVPQVPEEPTSAPEPVQYQPDQAVLINAKGDPAVWAGEVAKMLLAVTGTAFDASVFEPWFTSFGRQVASKEARTIAFMVSNMPIADGQDADASFLAVDVRNSVASQVRQRAGV